MIFEHIALNVADVAGIVTWYTRCIGLKVVKAQARTPVHDFFGRRIGPGHFGAVP